MEKNVEVLKKSHEVSKKDAKKLIKIFAEIS